MQVTYKLVEKHIEEYIKSLSNLRKDDINSINKSLSYLSKDYIVRYGDVPFESNVKEMISSIADESEKWITTVVSEYWIIDIEKLTVAGYFKEILKSPTDGKILRIQPMFTHMKLKVENDKLRICEEHMVDVPMMLRIDSLNELKC